MTRDKSAQLFERARHCIPGGVNSPVRAFRSVGLTPPFIAKADGCRIYDVDGNAYIDYVGSWGPMILGHRHPAVLDAIRQVLDRGTSFGAPTDLEIELAEMVTEAVPSVEKIRMVNSGTEATMSAIRLARGATRRPFVVKFDGCYHGHADTLLVDAGSGVATLNIPGSPGVPEPVTQFTLSLPYNDAKAFSALMDARGQEIAGVIVEPAAGNMGMVPPSEGFLETLREKTRAAGSLLIFDEVMTGFRLAYGGAQERFAIAPDVTCFGKIIGGGLPVGAYGGRKDIMQHVAPEGPVYQAGTLSGNPVAMAAGIATLRELKRPGVYETLEKASRRLESGLMDAATASGIDTTINRVGSMLGVFFTREPVRSFSEARHSNLERFSIYFREMLERGIYLAPSQFEALFVSLSHDDDAIDRTVEAAEGAFKKLTE